MADRNGTTAVGLVTGLGYVTLGVDDVAAATEFYLETARLAVTEPASACNGDRVFLSGDARHHWLELAPAAESDEFRLGYQVTDPDALAEAVRRLHLGGVATEVFDGERQGLSNGVRFTDPFGVVVELYVDMVRLGAPAVAETVGLDCLLHAVVNVPDPGAAAAFYEEVFGFRRSDRVKNLVVFLRSENRFHHSLAFGAGTTTGLDHFAIHVHELDHLMRLRNHALAEGTLTEDIVRHTASGSISMYLSDESSGSRFEFCTNHGRIEDPSYQGRDLVPSASTVNMWTDPWPTKGAVLAATAGSTATAVAGADAAPLPPRTSPVTIDEVV